jgi:hypothetical protein
MDRRKAVLTALIGLVGAVIVLGPSVYPFQYGLLESVVLAGAFVLLAVFETVLDDARFGAWGPPAPAGGTSPTSTGKWLYPLY